MLALQSYTRLTYRDTSEWGWYFAIGGTALIKLNRMLFLTPRLLLLTLI